MATTGGNSSTEINQIEALERTLGILNDEITKQDQTLLDFARGVDTKATFLAGFSVTAVSFLLGHRRGGFWTASVMVAGVGFVLAVMALWPRRWNGPKPSRLRDAYRARAPYIVLGSLVGTKTAIYERNHRIARAKTWLWVASVSVLGLAGVLMIVSVLSEAPHL